MDSVLESTDCYMRLEVGRCVCKGLFAYILCVIYSLRFVQHLHTNKFILVEGDLETKLLI